MTRVALLSVQDIEGYLKPMMAHDWDRASLLQFRSFGFEPVGDRIKDLGMPGALPCPTCSRLPLGKNLRKRRRK